jgi:arylsulfatase
MRKYICIAIICGITGLMECKGKPVIKKQSNPNILVVLLDDMGFSDIGCYGGEVETPTIDKLGENGLRFSNIHNNAKCHASRTSLLSGLYCYQAGNTSLRYAATFADIAKSKSYHTFATGKWHLKDHPMDRGFDRYFGHLAGATNYFTGEAMGNTGFSLDRDTFEIPEDFYATNYIMDYSLEFIEEAVKKDKPFLGYIAFNAPHSPLHAPKADVEKYYAVYKEGWDKLRDKRYKRMKELGVIEHNSKLSPRPDFVPAWEDLSKERKAFEIYRMATYAACIDVVDQNMARLVSYLKDNDLYDNTLILFMSDNGASPFERSNGTSYPSWDSRSGFRTGNAWAWMSNTPFRWFKQNQHEGGISTPLIAHYPNGLKGMKGQINHENGHFIDIMPTIVEILDAGYPNEIRGHKVEPMEGISLAKAFVGKQLPDRDYIYQQWSTNRALFKDDYKIVSFRANEWELYNIKEDRSELANLAQEKPELLKEMVELWRDIAENKDHLPKKVFYTAPSEEQSEQWGVRDGHDTVNQKVVRVFYNKLYPELGFECK